MSRSSPTVGAGTGADRSASAIAIASPSTLLGASRALVVASFATAASADTSSMSVTSRRSTAARAWRIAKSAHAPFTRRASSFDWRSFFFFFGGTASCPPWRLPWPGIAVLRGR